MRWRWAIALFSVAFAIVAWSQQHRAANAAAQSVQDAIQKTSESVAAKVRAADAPIIIEQTRKIDALQASLDAQSKGVAKIGDSPFVSGKQPVRVEVTNPAPPPVATPQTPVAVVQGHLTVIQQAEISTRIEYPYRIKVTIQSDIEFPQLKFLLRCSSPIGEAQGSIQGGNYMMMSNSGVDPTNRNNWYLYYQSATPAFGPANPLSVEIYAPTPIACSQTATY